MSSTAGPPSFTCELREWSQLWNRSWGGIFIASLPLVLALPCGVGLALQYSSELHIDFKTSIIVICDGHLGTKSCLLGSMPSDTTFGQSAVFSPPNPSCSYVGAPCHITPPIKGCAHFSSGHLMFDSCSDQTVRVCTMQFTGKGSLLQAPRPLPLIEAASWYYFCLP